MERLSVVLDGNRVFLSGVLDGSPGCVEECLKVREFNGPDLYVDDATVAYNAYGIEAWYNAVKDMKCKFHYTDSNIALATYYIFDKPEEHGTFQGDWIPGP